MARKLVVEIVGDASSLERSFKRASNATNTFDRDMGRVTRGSVAASGAFNNLGRSIAFASGGFLAGAGLTAGIKSTIDAASDLEQQIGKTNVVFGASAKNVEDWSATLAESFGLSQREALTTASTFGALFAPIGLTGRAAAEQSKQLTELGADLAAFYNTDVASALDALRSGLVGESEPLRKFGVQLSEVRVQQEALNETGKTTVASLTNQEKTLARIRIILQDSKVAQGNFAATADDAAQQVKIFQANVENLKAELGEGLVPALAGAASAANDFFRAIKPGGRLEFLNKGALENLSNLGKKIAPDSTAAGRFFRRHDTDPAGLKSGAQFADAIARAQQAVQEALASFTPEDPKEAKERVNRVRQAREAFRQEVEERARLAVDRTALTDTVADDIAALQALNALLRKRIAGGHNVLENERESIQVQLQINNLLKQQREAAAEAARERRDTRQFRLLGLGPGGEALVPGVNNLKRQLSGVMDAIEGSFLDTNKTRQRLRNIQRVLAEGIGNVSKDVRRQIQEILADLRNQLKKSSVDVTRFQHSARGQLTLAGANPQFGRGINIQGGIHLHGIQSVQDLENALAKRRKQRARQRRSTR